MLIELGHFLTIFAICLAGLMSFSQLTKPSTALTNVNTSALILTSLLGGFLGLTYAYVTSDFSVANVVANSHTDKPLLYKITGVWGNHEGSMLLWLLVIAGFGLGLAKQESIPQSLHTKSLGLQNLILFLFGAFVLLTSNPFERLAVAPLQGNDLNPLLQDPALAIHPPLLYMGYVGFSIPFVLAFAGYGSTELIKNGRTPACPGYWWHGDFSHWASCWAASGRITSWAGAAGGSGIQSKTPAFSHGYAARLCSIL